MGGSLNRNRWILIAICMSVSVLFVLGIRGWMIAQRVPPQGLEEKASESLAYARKYGMSEHLCLLLDYSIPSGRPRLFVWSYEKQGIIYEAHAMHGPGNGSTKRLPSFSNEPGSECSSIGRFRVTKQHGKVNKTGYLLKGLDATNSNAYRRALMIHSSYWVDFNRWRKYIPLNRRSCQGCVAVSHKDMAILTKLIEGENENLLLWGYCTEQ